MNPGRYELHEVEGREPVESRLRLERECAEMRRKIAKAEAEAKAEDRKPWWRFLNWLNEVLR